jgi:DNA mismatch repair protein MutS2
MALTDQTFITLEFPKVREKLARYTSFSASRELAQTLLPSTHEPEVIQRIQQTSEARRFINTDPDASIGGAHDVREQVHHAALGGILAPHDLLGIASTIISMRHLRHKLRKLPPTEYPILASYAGSLPELLTLENEIERTIDDNATVLDTASAKLSHLRSEIKIATSRIQDKLTHMVSSSQFAKVLQEPIVTVRNGRHVVPVKAAHRRSVPGLVHDQSASGATLYIEPMPVVELNNRLRELELAEEQEVKRILAMLSERVGAVADTIKIGVETLAVLDLAFACAKYADALNCVPPEIVTSDTLWATATNDSQQDTSPLSLIQARHPLLPQEIVVPIDVWMGNEVQLLVVTGPNTGGKTVALKTVGLLALMAQAGLHIPARERSRLPIFGQVFADIGDEQSIEQSLSTFSSHMKTIIRMLQEIEAYQTTSQQHPTLVLLDEIGAGTDPLEGAALARAIIQRFLNRKCMGIVTTHYAELKGFAYNTPGVENASVEFDSETLAPTYRLIIGLPGRSNALAIAARLGLDNAIVEQARSTMGQESSNIDGLLEDIHRKREGAEADRQRAHELRQDAEKYRDRLAEELAIFEQTREEHMRDALREVEEELHEARAELRRMKHQAQHEAMLQQQRENLNQQKQQQIDQTETHLQQVEKHVEQIRKKEQKAESVHIQGEPAKVLQVGDTVLVRSIGLTGQIVSIDEDDEVANVQVGNFRVNASLRELQREKRGKQQEKPVYESRGVNIPAATADVSMTLDMRGWRTADVADGLERYLNDAYLSGYPEVRLIHGKGSGALRKVVHDKIHNHPLIASFHGGGKDGGDGVTIARLVER